mgnify:CR=1 FL=1
MRYLFKTIAVTKSDKYYIDNEIVTPKYITADSVKLALDEYVKHADDCCVEITKTALKNRVEMYRESENGDKQIGYCITAHTEFEKGHFDGWVKKPIELWVEILTIVDTEF